MEGDWTNCLVPYLIQANQSDLFCLILAVHGLSAGCSEQLGATLGLIKRILILILTAEIILGEDFFFLFFY